MFDYIERFYNPKRRHSTIGYLSPMEFDLRQRRRGGADLFGGGEHALRRPEGVPAVRARHVRGDGRMPSPDGRAGVASDPHAAMEHLDGSLRGPYLNHLADQPGRHRVEVPLDLDVVIRGDAGAAPFGILIGLAGSGIRAGRSMVSKNSRRLAPSLRIRRALSSSTSTRMATFSSASEKKRRLRSRARSSAARSGRRPRPWPCRAACVAASA